MTSSPLVSIICLCFNQSTFVRETIESVIGQTYKNIELIVVDDGSADDSVKVIAECVQRNPEIKFLPIRRNIGNCRAFNEGFKMSRGTFVLDLAADDVLVPERIEKQIEFFHTLDSSFGVVFTDADYIDERGHFLRQHYRHLFTKKLLDRVPSGNVYKDVIQRYFICTPTMLSRREVFEVLNGYDQDLAYEDFDFCIRASRIYKFAFLNERLTKVRKVSNSMSARQYAKNDRQAESTYLVCRKIQMMNRDRSEDDALRVRVRYEIRQAVMAGSNREAQMFSNLLKELGSNTLGDGFWMTLNRLRLPLGGLRRFYQWIKYS